jgi:2-polyprenyl-3-methyl-5-hydroxy-6-metoxy-1,4-benzoquinol methylase
MMFKDGDDNKTSARSSRPTSQQASLATRRATSRQRRVWSRRVSSWDQHGSANLGTVTSAVIGVVAVQPGADVLDLGCGTGQISIPLANRGANVLGIDVSPAMASALRAEARRRGLARLAAVAVPIEELDMAPASLDLVVSSYALHHLRDADKARLVTAAFEWLRPGGRLVIADMMLGRGGSARDRAIIRGKLRVLARKGPGGWWRIAKNSWRYLARIQERPISLASWRGLLEEAGFTAITASALVAEAGLVTGARPEPGRGVPQAMAGAAAIWSEQS